MDDEDVPPPELIRALRTLAAEQPTSGASDGVRMRLLREIGALRRKRRTALMKFSVIATALSVAATIPIWQLATSRITHREPTSAPLAAEMATAFFPLVYATVPMSGGRLVRLEVPREAAELFGVEFPSASRVPALILADVMVGDDGLARAVRFVRPMTLQEQKERQR